MLQTDLDELTAIISRLFNIEDVTRGDGKQGYLVRYRGRLLAEDSAQAYDQLAEALMPRDITPLFRKENDQQVVLLVQGVIRPQPSKTWVNILLFGLTMLSVFFAGAVYTLGSEYQDLANLTFQSLLPNLPSIIVGGLAFMVSLLSILVAHEFGHYLAGRYHRTHVTLPYFIPLPIGLGTMGAVIRMKEPPKNKRILLDIGIAGPLAGLVVAIPVLIIGLMLSEVSPLPAHLPPDTGLEGNSLLYLLAKFLVFGQLLPAPSSYGGLSALQYWVTYFFTGHPLPSGGVDVMLSPVAWAAWAGLLVTALNLIPAGQLDGGHLIYVLLGKRANVLLPFILVILVLLGFAWKGWWLWAFLIFILGRMHAEPLDQITTLNPGRRALAWLGIIVFILVFTPVPLIPVGL